ncbi:MAG: hypothetical protein OXT67_08595 [Zetaproteobacteria bacterium]|nr:hypothetical protein [Zetaproteobacteria bacterium]
MVLDSSTVEKSKSTLKHASNRYEANRDRVIGDISEVSGERSASAWQRFLESEDQDVPLFLIQEAVIEWLQQKMGVEEITKAFEEFQTLMGRAFADEVIYNQRASYFLDYLVFERPTHCGQQQTRVSPFKGFVSDWISTHTHQLSPKKHEMLCSLDGYQHALFRVARSSRKRVIFENICSRQHLCRPLDPATENPSMFHKNLIYQGFIYPSPHGIKLSQGMFTHDRSVTRIILKSVKKKLKSEQDSFSQSMLPTLATLHLRHSRQRYISSAKVYRQALLENES